MTGLEVQSLFTNLLLPGGLLLSAVVIDLRTSKVKNKFVILAFAASVLFSLFAFGFSVIWTILGSILAALVFTLPIYKLQAIGGGDLKLFVAISPLLTWESVLVMIFASLVWGSVLGLFSAISHGHIKNLGQNLISMALRNNVQKESLHKIPFTVAIFFGWISVVTLQKAGVNLI